MIKKLSAFWIVFFCILSPFNAFAEVSSPVGTILAGIQLDSPRETYNTFMSAMEDFKRGKQSGDPKLLLRLDDAVRCLNLNEIPQVVRASRGRETAILLKEVIDRIAVLDSKQIPNEGKTSTEKLKKWRFVDTDIFITRMDSGDRSEEFLFSSETVHRVRDFYERVRALPYLPGSGGGALYKESWLETSAPVWSQGTIFLLPNWKWMAIALIFLGGLLLKSIIQAILHIFVQIGRVKKRWFNAEMIMAVERPIGLVCSCGFWMICLYFLRIEGRVMSLLVGGVQVILTVAVIWAIYKLSDVGVRHLMAFASKSNIPIDSQIYPLFEKS